MIMIIFFDVQKNLSGKAGRLVSLKTKPDLAIEEKVRVLGDIILLQETHLAGYIYLQYLRDGDMSGAQNKLFF
jgi:hypothetical protein